MTDLKYWQNKIKDYRKNTSFRDFLKEIVSFRSLGFYKNNGYISVYPETDRIGNIVSHDKYNEQRDNFTDKGIDYDSSLGFFENLKILHNSIEFQPTNLFGTCENAEFTDQSRNINNSYLSYVLITDCENVFYSFSVKEGSSNIFNSFMVWDNCENIYFGTGVIKSYNVFYSRYIMNSSDIFLSSNLIGCNNCILCNNLENQSYCIENKVYSKEEYKIKKSQILSDNSSYFSQYKDIIKNTKGEDYGSEKTQGYFNIQCNNVENGYFNYQVENGRNAILIGGKELGENVYDCFLNTPPQKDFYGVYSGGYGENIYNSYHLPFCNNIMYSYLLESCSYCIGCIGLKNKSYCILNKQYEKAAWEKLANEIFESMENEGTLGKFFPAELNPFYFNDTMAYMLGDFQKKEIVADGYLWRDEELKVDIPDESKVIEIKDLNDFQGYEDDKWHIDEKILDKVIKDEDGKYYKIIRKEYDFLVKNGLPLPEIHWMDRIKLNFGI